MLKSKNVEFNVTVRLWRLSDAIKKKLYNIIEIEHIYREIITRALCE